MAAAGRWSFALPVVVFGMACAAVLWGTLTALSIAPQPLHGGILVYFTVLTLFLHGWMQAGADGDSKVLVRRFMAGMALKMMLSLILLLVLLLTRPRQEVLLVALVFMGCYLAFLIFSTATGLRSIRGQGRT